MAGKAVVIGAGFGGLSAAGFLAKNGYRVTVLEKNESAGGRARVWREQGFTYDMGPSWYLMPEVFDDYFAKLGKKREDRYRLVKLDPYYRVFFGEKDHVDVTSDLESTCALFERFEPGAGEKLKQYLKLAEYKYDIAMKEFMYVEYRSVFQFFNKKMATQGLKLNLFKSLDKFVRRFFQDRRARQILEYAMVFLGNSPVNAPALYSIMSHVDLNLGVWYPYGGMGKIVEAMVDVNRELGVEIVYNSPVNKLVTENGKIVKAVAGGKEYPADVFLVNADYHHADTELLDKPHRSYTPRYWDTRVVAPSMFILYLGINKKLPELTHHNLYFTENWDAHFDMIFKKPGWSDDPCFYLSCPSKSDDTVAPKGKENLFVLVPVAPGLDDNEDFRRAYAEKIIAHVERITGISIKKDIIVQRIFSHRDFSTDYNAFRGTALGISHTLNQTAIFRPSPRSRKIKNLFYSGHYTHPGVGVPMTLISSEVAVRAITGEN